jgi:hypothetical protein
VSESGTPQSQSGTGFLAGLVCDHAETVEFEHAAHWLSWGCVHLGFEVATGLGLMKLVRVTVDIGPHSRTGAFEPLVGWPLLAIANKSFQAG